ncbi:MAG: DUF2018 family protein [Sulfurospirillaceae bacterium]|nr:DUF2018 family protein [Sulfurospirillaceae bacterium]
MLYEDEDDFLVGSVKSKFFDIVFHANRDRVEESLLRLIERYNAMELLLEESLGEDFSDVDRRIKEVLFERQDDICSRNNDLLITFAGEVLTQNE